MCLGLVLGILYKANILTILECQSDLAKVAFGERDGVCIGHALLAVNGEPLTYKELPDGRDVFEVHNLTSESSPGIDCSMCVSGFGRQVELPTEPEVWSTDDHNERKDCACQHLLSSLCAGSTT